MDELHQFQPDKTAEVPTGVIMSPAMSYRLIDSVCWGSFWYLHLHVLAFHLQLICTRTWLISAGATPVVVPGSATAYDHNSLPVCHVSCPTSTVDNCCGNTAGYRCTDVAGKNYSPQRDSCGNIGMKGVLTAAVPNCKAHIGPGGLPHR